jgi:hypothetical protein
MFDALLFAVRDAIRGAGFGYDARTCDITYDGRPPTACGDFFLSVHQGNWRSDMMNALDEYFGFSLTLTMRVSIPLNRLGDQRLVRQLARQYGFDAKMTQLISFLHMNWGIVGDANNNLVALLPDVQTVDGFCEPAHFTGMDVPAAVGGEWFEAEPTAANVGIKAEARFEDCRRLQALQTFS